LVVPLPCRLTVCPAATPQSSASTPVRVIIICSLFLCSLSLCSLLPCSLFLCCARVDDK
jgi:hypothetical protein